MNINQLIYVTEVYKWQSFSLAAQHNFVSQSGISKAIIELETELGFEIFLRNHRGIYDISPRGQEFLEQCLELVEQFDNLKRRYSNDSTQLKVCSINNNTVNRVFQEFFKDKVSEFELQATLSFGSSFEVTEQVLKKDYDLGVVVTLAKFHADWAQSLTKRGLEYIPVAPLTSFFIVRKDDPNAHKEFLDFGDLEDYTFLQIYHPVSKELNYNDYVFKSLRANVMKNVLSLPSREMAYEMLQQEKTFHSEADVTIDHEAFAKRGLICRPYREPYLYDLGIIKRRNVNLSPVANEFIRHLTQVFRSQIPEHDG